MSRTHQLSLSALLGFALGCAGGRGSPTTPPQQIATQSSVVSRMSCRRDAVQPGNKACSKRANSGVYEQTCLNGVWHDTDQCLCRGIEIGDIAPLAALTQLEQLALFENHISDLTPLRQQAQLTSLEIGNNCISDLSPLAGLSKLEHLSADFNAIVDASPLSGANG